MALLKQLLILFGLFQDGDLGFQDCNVGFGSAILEMRAPCRLYPTVVHLISGQNLLETFQPEDKTIERLAPTHVTVNRCTGE